MVKQTQRQSDNIGMSRVQREALLEIENRRGTLRKEDVVAEASDADHPLHSRFEWNDTKGGHLYRLIQADRLIQSCKLRVVDRKDIFLRAPLFVKDPRVGSHEQGYVSVTKLQDDEEAARDAVLHAYKQVLAYLTRARAIGEALGLAKEADRWRREVLAEVARLNNNDEPSPSGPPS